MGLNEARGEVLLCLNPDASLRPGALSALVSWFRGRPERDGVVGCALEDGAGRPERTYGRFPAAREFVSRPFRRESAAEGGGARRVDWVTGAFLAMRRAVVAAGVRFDEGYPLYVEDVDLCRQAKRAGFDVWYEPRDWARHDRGGAPAGAARRRLRRLGEARFLRKWGGVGAWPLAAAYWLVAGGGGETPIACRSLRRSRGLESGRTEPERMVWTIRGRGWVGSGAGRLTAETPSRILIPALTRC